MKDDLKNALSAQLVAMGDDELILGHRDSEWCGHAPILEEDIAFANIALDEIGHASQWYALLTDLLGEDPESYPDRLVYRRPAGDFRNTQMVELPKGDWAFSMLRQFLFDSAELVRLQALSGSRHTALADTAAKIRKEEIYHHRHTQAWVERLGKGTEESHRRLQAALEALWPYVPQLFSPLADEGLLVEAGYLPDSLRLFAEWQGLVLPFFDENDLSVPPLPEENRSRDQHTQHMKILVAEMQSVARLDPQANW